MKQSKWLVLAGMAAALSACGGKQEASKGNFKQAIEDSVTQERVCLPLSVAIDTDENTDVLANGMLGDKQIRIPLKNTRGKRINNQALKQMDVLEDADLYRRDDDAEQLIGIDTRVPVAVFERTEKGDKQVLPDPSGSLLCLGTQKVDDIVLFTDPTPANGVTVSKVVYEAKLVPEKWVDDLLENSDKALIERVQTPHRQHITLVLTSRGWRDLRELR